jgi:hypothetical protein
LIGVLTRFPLLKRIEIMSTSQIVTYILTPQKHHKIVV